MGGASHSPPCLLVDGKGDFLLEVGKKATLEKVDSDGGSVCGGDFFGVGEWVVSGPDKLFLSLISGSGKNFFFEF